MLQASSIRGGALALCAAAVLAGATPALAAGAPACAKVPEQDVRRDFNRFVDMLLIERKPREAFEAYAVANLAQHSAAFGANRDTTIAQWNTMITPTSRFAIKEVSIAAGIGVVRFRGHLGPGAGADVTDYFRFDCGKIVETWDSFEVAD